MGRAGEKVDFDFELPEVVRTALDDSFHLPEFTTAVKRQLAEKVQAAWQAGRPDEILAFLRQNDWLLDIRHNDISLAMMAAATMELRMPGIHRVRWTHEAVARFFWNAGVEAVSSPLLIATTRDRKGTSVMHVRESEDATETLCGLAIESGERSFTKRGSLYSWNCGGRFGETTCGECRAAAKDLPLFRIDSSASYLDDDEELSVLAAAVPALREGLREQPIDLGGPQLSTATREATVKAMRDRTAALAAKRFAARPFKERYKLLFGADTPRNYDMLLTLNRHFYGSEPWERAWPDEERMTELFAQAKLPVQDSITEHEMNANRVRAAFLAEVWPQAAQRMAEVILKPGQGPSLKGAMEVWRQSYPELVEAAEEAVASASNPNAYQLVQRLATAIKRSEAGKAYGTDDLVVWTAEKHSGFIGQKTDSPAICWEGGPHEWASILTGYNGEKLGELETDRTTREAYWALQEHAFYAECTTSFILSVYPS